MCFQNKISACEHVCNPSERELEAGRRLQTCVQSGLGGKILSQKTKTERDEGVRGKREKRGERMSTSR